MIFRIRLYELDEPTNSVIARVARFLAAKYGRLLSIRDVRQGQYDAISSQTKSPFSRIR